MINISNLTKAYGQNLVLKGINKVFEKGKIYGIVGENGAGKTTLFKCIGGLETYSGEISSEYNPLKKGLGYLPTIPDFMSRITGWEYLKLMSIARGISTEGFEKENVFDLPLDLYAENYSTGMKKKLALHGILKQRNEIFILDEPFNGVDIQSNLLISEIINELREKNKYVLISSHIFSTLSELCDEILLLENGQIQKSVAVKDFAALNEELKTKATSRNYHKITIE